MLLSHMNPLLVCHSCVCHCLRVCLVLLRILLLIFNSLWRGWVIGSSLFAYCFFFGLVITWAWAFSSLIQPLSPFTSGLWANWYSCHAIALLLPWYRLTCASWTSFELAMYYSFSQFTLPSISVGSVLVSSWAFSAHFILLDIPILLHSFGYPCPISFLNSHGLLLNLSGFPCPIIMSFTFGVCWHLHQFHLLISLFGLLRLIFACFLLLMIPMCLLLPSLGSLGPICFLQGPFYHFIGLWTIIPAIRA